MRLFLGRSTRLTPPIQPPMRLATLVTGRSKVNIGVGFVDPVILEIGQHFHEIYNEVRRSELLRYEQRRHALGRSTSGMILLFLMS